MGAYTLGALVGTVIRLLLGFFAARAGIRRFSLNAGTAWTVIIVLTAVIAAALPDADATFANAPWIMKFYVKATGAIFVIGLLLWIASLVAGKKTEKAAGANAEDK